MSYKQLTAKEALDLKKGRVVYFYQPMNVFSGFDCKGKVKEVYRSKNGTLWASLTNVESLDGKHSVKSELKKQVRLLCKRV